MVPVYAHHLNRQHYTLRITKTFNEGHKMVRAQDAIYRIQPSHHRFLFRQVFWWCACYSVILQSAHHHSKVKYLFSIVFLRSSIHAQAVVEREKLVFAGLIDASKRFGGATSLYFPCRVFLLVPWTRTGKQSRTMRWEHSIFVHKWPMLFSKRQFQFDYRSLRKK